MNESSKIKQIKENLQVKKKLNELGICSTIGPTGPTGPRGIPGTNLDIKGYYSSLDELKQEKPIGNDGDTYVVNGDLYYWDTQTIAWESAGHISGPTGPKVK